MASPHLSGVLFEPERKIVYKKNGQVVRTETKPLFTVDDNGSIQIESMKGSKHYEFAKSCDSEIENGLLQGSEIRKFLERFKDKNVYTDVKDMMYYRETNSNGVVTKICSLGVNDCAGGSDQQNVLNYDNEGKLVSQVLYQTPGNKYEGRFYYDMETNTGVNYTDDGMYVSGGSLTYKTIESVNNISEKTKNQKPKESTVSKILKWFSW